MELILDPPHYCCYHSVAKLINREGNDATQVIGPFRAGTGLGLTFVVICVSIELVSDVDS